MSPVPEGSESISLRHSRVMSRMAKASSLNVLPRPIRPIKTVIRVGMPRVERPVTLPQMPVATGRSVSNQLSRMTPIAAIEPKP